MIIVLMGGSSVGKSLIQTELNKRFNIPVCVSSTTRPKRISEKEDVDYHFLSEKQFLDDFHKGKFVEHRTYSTVAGNWYYGLSKDSIDIHKNQLAIVDQQGYYSLVKTYGQENVLGIYIYAPEEVKLKRAQERESRKEKDFYRELYRRFADDLDAFNLVEKDEKVFKVINLILDAAITKITRILKQEGVIA